MGGDGATVGGVRRSGVESQLHVLPTDVTGQDVLELGCGTAYVSGWLARRGASVVVLDNSAAQLATARRLQREHDLVFPLLHGNAEAVPHPDATFDVVISEYGACLWADPHLWVPEAARLLRDGGRLIFLVNSALIMLCMPEEHGVAATDRLVRPAFGMHRVEHATTDYPFVTVDWARRWPCEEVWKARRVPR